MRYYTLLIVSVLIISSAAAVARPDKHKSKADDQNVERTTAADPKVVLSVCLGTGNVTIRGWDRNEVHARMTDGIQIEFQPSAMGNSGAPKEISLGIMSDRRRSGNRCLPFGSLELDVPREATVKVEAGDAEISSSGVAKLNIDTQNGAITVANATRAVDVNTLGGEIVVRNSQGTIKVHSVGGAIEVRDVRPVVPEDVCEIGNVGGDINLKNISQRKVRVDTVGGDITFQSALARGGNYSFQSISGDLSLMLPPDSSFRFSATIQDEPDSDFAIKYSSQDQPPADTNRKYGPIPRRFDGTYGTGDALINFSSFMGSVQLRKN
jgi:hypothetical protein